MSKARNLADLLDANGDVVSGSLDNVPTADVVNDTTPQLGGTLDTNGNDINFGDNDNANFGAGNDLTIYHNSATGESFIEESGTGNLYVRGTNLRLQDTLGANYFSAQSGGESYLYHNGLQRVQVNTSGITVTGTVAATSYTGDGSSLTGTGAPTTFGAVGSYAWLIYHASGTGPDVGSTTGGSNLRYKTGTSFSFGTGVIMYRQDANAVSGGSSYPLNSPGGTWRNMGPQLSGSEGTSVSHHRTHNLWVRTA